MTTLQWGLACSGKVSRVGCYAADLVQPLQWGLACSGKVSRMQPLLTATVVRGFNGASPVRAR